MAVEQDGFDLGQHAVVAVEVRPARLHHADSGLGKVVDDLHEPVGRGHKVGVEDGDELALGHLEAGVERAGLEAVTIGAVDVDDGMAQRGVAVDDGGGNLAGFVGRVVEHLDFELFARIFHGADRLNQAVDDELLVEDGQLHGDLRQLVKMARRIGVVVLAVLEVEIAHRVAVDAVDRQHNHDREVGQQQSQVEPVPVVKSLEGLVGVLHLQVVAQPVLRGEGEERRGMMRQETEQAGRKIQAVSDCGRQGESSLKSINFHCKRWGKSVGDARHA